MEGDPRLKKKQRFARKCRKEQREKEGLRGSGFPEGSSGGEEAQQTHYRWNQSSQDQPDQGSIADGCVPAFLRQQQKRQSSVTQSHQKEHTEGQRQQAVPHRQSHGVIKKHFRILGKATILVGKVPATKVASRRRSIDEKERIGDDDRRDSAVLRSFGVMGG